MNPSPVARFSLQARKGEIVVQMRGVSRYFDNPGFIRALTNVSFEVHRGEVFGLLGPSGSGKSTAVRILAGRLAPSEGKAKVFARSPRRRATRARISYLPQKPAHARSHFLMTAMGFLRDLVAGAKRDSRSQNGSDEPDGQQRLGALKRILLQATRVVLIDEPFSALDATGCSEMMELIRALAQQGRTVIICSRSLIYAKDVCDRLAVLHRGELQAIGTVQELLARRESLRFIVDLLPGETAEHLLQLVRLELGMSDPAKSLSFEPPMPSPPERDAADLPSTPHRPAAPSERVLARLVKADAPADRPIDQPNSTVNHEMLAALTKDAGKDPPPRLEAKSESPPPADAGGTTSG